MKSVLMSIQPKWCELIANGKKTVEVRKTKPKLETPFKVYIYCTKPRHFYKISKHLLTSDESLFLVNDKVKMCDGFGVEYEDPNYKHLNCKVIGEFVCDKITDARDMDGDEFYPKSCLTYEDWRKYTDVTKNTIWLWHISNLVIYDKPRELSEFRKPIICHRGNDRENCKGCWDCEIKRPPQSWCYVESEVITNEQI